jgi:hypothetical protein
VTRLDMEQGVDVAPDLSAAAVFRVVPLVLVCGLATDYSRRELDHSCNDGIFSRPSGFSSGRILVDERTFCYCRRV